jgi:hypothetical protein
MRTYHQGMHALVSKAKERVLGVNS